MGSVVGGKITWRSPPGTVVVTTGATVDDVVLVAATDDVVVEDDGSAQVYTSFTEFHAVNEALAAAGFKADEAEIAMIPSISAPVADLETAQKVLRLIDALEDLDDVQNVYHNAEISNEIMEQLD